jgi:tRNA pseudouridine65 synthase
VHRLDRKTSGILLFAKAKQYVSSFQGALDSEVSQKKYLALLRGFTPETGTIDSPVKNENKVYKEAKTSFRTLIHIERNFEIVPYPTQRYSVVEFTAHTGRYHQLRQHANKIAHPIINDPKHGNRHHNHYFQDKLNIPYLFLHAYSLMLQHPFTHEKIDFQQETPGFWTDFLQDDMQRLLQKV